MYNSLHTLEIPRIVRLVAPSSRAFVVIAMLLAIGGGVLVSVFYEPIVHSFGAMARTMSAVVAPLAAHSMVGPEDTPAGPEIDPFSQAIAAARVALGDGALVDVDARNEDGVVFLTGRVDSRRTSALVAEAIGVMAGVRAVDARHLEIVPKVHVVQPGDTLGRIARKYYGPGMAGAWRRIVSATPALQDSSVFIGQEVVVPSLDL